MIATIDRVVVIRGKPYDQLCNCSLSRSSDTIKTINGLSFQEFMQQMGNEMGVSRDRGQRLARALGGYPVRYSGYNVKMPTANEKYQFVFGDDSTLAVPAVWYVGGEVKSVANLRSQVFRNLTTTPLRSPLPRDPRWVRALSYVDVDTPKRLMWRDLAFKYESDVANGHLPSQGGSTVAYVDLETPKRLMLRDLSLKMDGSEEKGASNAVTLVLVVGGALYQTYCYRLSDNSSVVFRLDTFAGTYLDPEEWMGQVLTIQQTCIGFAKNNSIPNLMIDLRGNGGGYVW